MSDLVFFLGFGSLIGLGFLLAADVLADPQEVADIVEGVNAFAHNIVNGDAIPQDDGPQPRQQHKRPLEEDPPRTSFTEKMKTIFGDKLEIDKTTQDAVDRIVEAVVVKMVELLDEEQFRKDLTTVTDTTVLLKTKYLVGILANLVFSESEGLLLYHLEKVLAENPDLEKILEKFSEAWAVPRETAGRPITVPCGGGK